MLHISPRIDFQLKYAAVAGTILNVGCENDPVGLGDRSVHVDVDRWKCHRRFVQADAHNLPFGDQSFDTVILGDILEHVLQPQRVVEEACRVSSRIVCATIFEEWRLGGPGQHLENDQDTKERVAHRTSEVVEEYPEQQLRHLFHINQFVGSDIVRLFSVDGFEVIEAIEQFEVIHEGHPIYNWLIAMRREQ